jgi:phosphoglycerol transferase MdoB-like AlkP superfamily enzyme
MPAACVALIRRPHWRCALAWIVVAAGTLLVTADDVYFAWFGDTLPAVAGLALQQVGTLRGSIADLISGSDLWNFVDLLIAVPIVRAAWRLPRPARSWRNVAIVEAALVLVLIVSGRQASRPIAVDPTVVSQRFSNISLVEQIGPFPFHLVDASIAAQHALATRLMSDQDFDEVAGWLEARAPLRSGTGPWFGAAAGKNLIVIQVESLQAAMVTLRIHDQDVMPNLRALAAQSISFADVIDQTDEGRTSDAEWIMLTSQLPEAHGAAAFIDQGNHVVGVPSVLASAGYDSLSAVAFSPSFWNRRVMHENLGFLRNYFAADFTSGDRIGWGLNDRDFLMQITPRLAAAQQPFAAWLITLSLHYPFAEFPDAHKTLHLKEWEGTPFGNYVHAMNFFDRALGEFIASLKTQGLLDSSVLVVTGDHSAGLRWQPEVAHALGFSNDIAHWTMAERVPLVMHVPGRPPVVITRPTGQIDFAPTVLGLLGIDAAPLPYIGRNQLGEPGDEPVLRRKGSWVDAAHLFVLRGDGHGSHCYERTTLKDVPLSDCLDSRSEVAIRKALLPRQMSAFDLQQRLFARLSADAAGRHLRSTAAPLK